jgi:hypothetical protein
MGRSFRCTTNSNPYKYSVTHDPDLLQSFAIYGIWITRDELNYVYQKTNTNVHEKLLEYLVNKHYVSKLQIEPFRFKKTLKNGRSYLDNVFDYLKTNEDVEKYLDSIKSNIMVYEFTNERDELVIPFTELEIMLSKTKTLTRYKEAFKDIDLSDKYFSYHSLDKFRILDKNYKAIKRYSLTPLWRRNYGEVVYENIRINEPNALYQMADYLYDNYIKPALNLTTRPDDLDYMKWAMYDYTENNNRKEKYPDDPPNLKIYEIGQTDKLLIGRNVAWSTAPFVCVDNLIDTINTCNTIERKMLNNIVDIVDEYHNYKGKNKSIKERMTIYACGSCSVTEFNDFPKPKKRQ